MDEIRIYVGVLASAEVRQERIGQVLSSLREHLEAAADFQMELRPQASGSILLTVQAWPWQPDRHEALEGDDSADEPTILPAGQGARHAPA